MVITVVRSSACPLCWGMPFGGWFPLQWSRLCRCSSAPEVIKVLADWGTRVCVASCSSGNWSLIRRLRR